MFTLRYIGYTCIYNYVTIYISVEGYEFDTGNATGPLRVSVWVK